MIMDLFMLALSSSLLLYFAGLNWGKHVGANEMRPKVVAYCVEKPQLCKEEYNSIKTQNKLKNYKLPEIK